MGCSWAILLGMLAGCIGQPEKPNFIFILADDWGWGDSGFNNPAKKHTPNLDNMARSGVIFSDFHTVSPVCSPSRAGFMTGRDPAQFRIHTALNTNWAANKRKDQANFLNPSELTVTQLLKDSGYVTGHFGKWHLGSGMDATSSASAPHPTEYGIMDSCTFNSNDPCQADGATGNTSVDIIGRAMDFVASAKATGQPFYVNIWLHVSHNRLDPTEEQKAAASGHVHCQAAKLATNQTECAELVFIAAQQDADAQIGRLNALIGQLNLRESTLILFSTDNGPEEQQAYMNAQGVTGPFRGRKRSLYEGGTRVPSFAVWGGHRADHRMIPAGSVEHTPVSANDWLPTVAAIAGLSLPTGTVLDGEDMSRVFLRKGTGQRMPLARTTRIFWEWIYSVPGPCDNVAPHLAVRDGDWKYLSNADGSRPELYKLDVYNASDSYEPDFHERRNLLVAFPEKARELAQALQDWQASLPHSSSRQYNYVPSCEQFSSDVFPGGSFVEAFDNEAEDSEPDTWFDPSSGHHVSFV